jgi:hypothetical protein
MIKILFASKYVCQLTAPEKGGKAPDVSEPKNLE